MPITLELKLSSSQQRKFTFTLNEKETAAKKSVATSEKGKGRGKKSKSAPAEVPKRPCGQKRVIPDEDEEEDEVAAIYGDGDAQASIIKPKEYRCPRNTVTPLGTGQKCHCKQRVSSCVTVSK